MKMPQLSSRTPQAGRLPAPSGAASDAVRCVELAVQFEELLDQVWRCEPEWRLDDRIAFACRRRRR